MRPGRIVALVFGCLLILPALALLIGGGALGAAYLVERDDDGYFDVTLDPIRSDTVAVTAEDLAFGSDPGSPDWILDAVDADVRLRVTAAESSRDVFVGIAREADVDRYLAGVAHDEIIDVNDGLEPSYRTRGGNDVVSPPAGEDFWVESASGIGTQVLDWEAQSGRWAAVLMNADGSTGVDADVNVGAKVGFVVPLIFILLGLGALLAALAITLIVVGARGGVQPEAEELEVEGAAPLIPGAASGVQPPEPVALEARLDPGLSSWQWLVKWFLAIPHFVVLVFLWMAFLVLTVVAGFAILFTGRYPEGIFEFNRGVLRWSWRVSYYATTGGIGTDQYPPFSLQRESDYPATLDIEYPQHLSRGLVLVKWWLLALPHYLVLGVLLGSLTWVDLDGSTGDLRFGGGLLSLLVIFAGVALLFTKRYPPGLFDLIVGLNRWEYRVIAYAALMTDRYPPFRLDQGGSEPGGADPRPPVGPSRGREVDLRGPESASVPVAR